MPDRLVTRLAAELDAVRPGHPRPAHARYRRVRAGRAPRRRLGGLAAATAVGGLALAAIATLATGSPNPQVWTGTVAGQLQRLEEPSPAPASPPATPPGIGAPAPQSTLGQPAAPSEKAVEPPQPTDNAHGGRGQRPTPSPGPHDPGAGDGHGGHQSATSDLTPPGR